MELLDILSASYSKKDFIKHTTGRFTTLGMASVKTNEVSPQPVNITSKINQRHSKRGQTHRIWFFLVIIGIVFLAGSVGSVFFYRPHVETSLRKTASIASPSQGLATAFITVSPATSFGTAPVRNTFTPLPTHSPTHKDTDAIANS